jgi:hypothetical protein
MDLSLSNLAVVENPPWISSDPDAVAAYFESSLRDALKTKLRSVQGATQSVELNRQILLALHEFRLRKAQTELIEATLDSQLHFRHSKVPCLQSVNHEVDLVVYYDTLPKQVRLSDFLPSSYAVEFSQVLLLHFLSFLIDSIADYWNTVAQARAAWKSSASTFRQLLERALQFKPLHTPSRMIPRSIHPIGSAA